MGPDTINNAMIYFGALVSGNFCAETSLTGDKLYIL